MTRALCAWAINRRGKNEDPQFAVQTEKMRLVIGIDFCIFSLCGLPVLHKGILFLHLDPNREDLDLGRGIAKIFQDLGKVF